MVRNPGSQKSGRPSPDRRRQAVLSAIIQEHLVSGEAIGSHTVSERFARATGWSSATIRNVMGELEDLGLLEQPHTSAGRVPTDKGYRYYVDNMLDSTRLSRTDLKAIESIGFGNEIKARPDRLMEKASHVLSELSESVGIVVWPSLAENRLKHIRFVRLPDNRVLVVLVSTSNIVHDKVIGLDEDFSQEELNRAARYLNVEFSGKSLLAIRAEIIALMREEKAFYDTVLRNAMLLCTFEEKSRLVKILNECVSGDQAGGRVNVVIGRENAASSMKRCTVITSTYQVDGEVLGTLGVVGPMRIEYGRMMAVVNYLARFIERALSQEASLH